MYIIYTRVSAKLRTLPSGNVLFAGGSRQGQCLLITDRVVNSVKISWCDNTSVTGARHSHLPAAEETFFLPGRPDVHNSIVSPPSCRPDDTVTAITTAVWSIIGATILNRPSWLLILMRSRTRGSFPFHVRWDLPPPAAFFTVELWQRPPATTESPRTAAGRPCTPLFACTGSNTTPPL